MKAFSLLPGITEIVDYDQELPDGQSPHDVGLDPGDYYYLLDGVAAGLGVSGETLTIWTLTITTKRTGKGRSFLTQVRPYFKNRRKRWGRRTTR